MNSGGYKVLAVARRVMRSVPDVSMWSVAIDPPRGASAAALCFGQLQQVVDGADQAPFTFHVGEAPQQELAEAARLLDLPKHRLGQLLTQAVAAAPSRSRKARAHGTHPSSELPVCSRGRAGLAVALTAGSQVGAHVASGQQRQIAFRAVAGVGGELARLAAQVGFDLPEHRVQLQRVAGVVREVLSED